MRCATLTPPPALVVCFLAHFSRAHVRRWEIQPKSYVFHCAIRCFCLFFIWAFWQLGDLEEGRSLIVVLFPHLKWGGLIFNPSPMGPLLLAYFFRKGTSWKTPILVAWFLFPIPYLSLPSTHYEPYSLFPFFGSTRHWHTPSPCLHI